MKIVRILAAILVLGGGWLGKAAERDLILGINELGFEVLRRIVAERPKENVLISPVSLGLSLALLEQGADEEADRELKEIVGAARLSREQIRSGARKLRAILEKDLVVAQSLWLDDALEARADFLAVAQKDFGAEVRREDFGAAGIGALANAWVSEKTRGLISSVDFPVGSNRSLAGLNAVYFLGKWRAPFDRDRTMQRRFKGSERSQAIFMRREEELSYKRWGGMQHVVLDYAGGNYCMDLLLPGRLSGVRRALKDLKAARLDEEASNMQLPIVKLAMPKFEMEADTRLTELLRAMGLKHVLSEGAFPGIAEGICLEELRQKTVLKVDEEKTEAAALTLMTVMTIGLEPEKPKVVEVVLDRPFIYAVRNPTSAAILFLGVAQQIGIGQQ